MPISRPRRSIPMSRASARISCDGACSRTEPSPQLSFASKLAPTYANHAIREQARSHSMQNDKIGVIGNDLRFLASLDDYADAPRVPLSGDLGDAHAHPRSMKFLEYDLRH